MEKRDLAYLISKLNDRNLQRKRESGFTTYVLISALLIILWNTIDLIHLILGDEIDFKLVEFFLLSINFSFSLIGIISVNYSTIGHKTSVRYLSKELRINSFLESFCYFLLFFLPFSLSVILIINDHNWFNITCAIFYGLISLIFFLSNRDTKVRKGHRLEKISETGKPIESKGFGFYLLMTMALFMIPVSTVYLTYNTFPSSITDNLTAFIKLSVLIYSIPIVSLLIFESMKESVKNRLLDELEVNIYLNKMTDEEILSRLRERYFGININNWIIQQEGDFEELFNKIESELSSLNSFYEESIKIDKGKYKREVLARKQEMSDKLFSTQSLLNQNIRKINIDIENIIDEGDDDLDENERKKLYEFRKVMQNKLTSISAKLEEIEKKIEKIL